MIKWYPIKFEPILKEKIWGGNKLHKVLDKPTLKENIGESWEISAVNGNVSIVTNGTLKGKSLKDLIIDHKEALVGKDVYRQFGNEFPLLIKFIDADTDLSVQLHPNDTLAQQRHQSFGKTEMWHIMQAEERSRLILGFENGTDASGYQQHLTNKTLPSILNEVPVKRGDTFFIPTGTVHAIGAGILLAEIQQTSDITYRVYDWDRVDTNGKGRTLHIEEAVDAINFRFKGEKSNYSRTKNVANQMVSCSYFTANYLDIDESRNIDNKDKDSFVIYMCTEGEAVLEGDGFKEHIKFGETVLIPSALKNFQINTSHVKLLEIFI